MQATLLKLHGMIVLRVGKGGCNAYRTPAVYVACCFAAFQRSGRARKVRNLDDDRFAANKGTTRSSSPTPGPSDAAEELTQQQGGRAGHKRMRLDACSSQGAGALGSASPQPSSRTPQQQQQGQPMEADMPPALDLWVAPEPLALEPEAAAPRRRRIPRKAGPRASARKRMHRATFKRGKPQRAPVA
jgi:hypothetical protein